MNVKGKIVIKDKVVVVLLIFIFSYLLNFVWESWHAVYLYEEHTMNARKFVFMIGYASMVDAFLILLMYFIVALLWREFFWIWKFRGEQVAVFVAAALLIAVFIEYRAVFLLDKWRYSVLMPQIFGIGLSPLVQLAVTGLIVLWGVRQMLVVKPIKN